ncbi:MAG: SdrD B-like domain-containing protein [Gammaproteobacteria bacterium]
MKTIKTTLLTTAVAAALSMGSTAYAGPSFTEKAIGAVGWSLTYAGKTYDAASNTTTFNYTLTAASTEKDLSHWVLALSDAPVTSSGCSNVKNGLDPTTGVYGWKCDDGQTAGSTRSYSITVNGNVGEAAAQYAVKGGTYFAVGGTTGPGAPIAAAATYSIAGVAYVDANNNGLLDAGEPRLPNVSVTLDDGQSTKTDAEGAYTFGNQLAGTYQVTIPTQTPEIADDFNETLAGYFIPTTAASLNVNVGPNAADQNFGFDLDAQAVKDDFDAADPDGNGFTFSGTGKTIGFWKHQITSAKLGKTKGVQVTTDVVKDYLYSGTIAIDNMFLDVFANLPSSTPGAYDYALSILGSTSSKEVDLLKKQLMGTELNLQAGLGISNQPLQQVLAAWSEYLVQQAASFSREQLLGAKDICDLINNSGE